jgi:hypothetical protein
MLNPPHPPELIPGPCSTFTDFLDQLEPWESQLVGCYEFMTIANSQELQENAIQFNTVSDGSDDSGYTNDFTRTRELELAQNCVHPSTKATMRTSHVQAT